MVFSDLPAAAAETDEEIVRRVRHGETNLFEVLMRRYNQRVFRVARSVIADEAEAEDVLQHAWVRAFEHLAQFEGRASFATWVTKIAYYEALARVRASGRRVALEDEEGEVMPEAEARNAHSCDPERHAMQNELGLLLERAVDALPEAYRAVFMLREVERLSTAETAECLCVSEEAVKTRLHRSRALLRHDLMKRAGSAIAGAYAFQGWRCDRTVRAVLAKIAPTA